MARLVVSSQHLTLSEFTKISVNGDIQIDFEKEVYDRVAKSRQVLELLLKDGRTVYGVNTGMGGFVGWLIPKEQQAELQLNLINGVATNVGDFLPDEVVRASMLARIYSLARGHSAISEENFRKLIALFNAGIVPCVPEKGSLGTSGDLGPLACIALVGVGQWRAKYNGTIISGAEALKAAGIEPMKLDYKEGLALVNGTSTMVGLATLLVNETERLLDLYDTVSALTLETLHAKRKPFDPRVHALKSHAGQQITAERIFTILADSKMIVDEDTTSSKLRNQHQTKPEFDPSHIEDAYSLRCTPQIIGPIRDSLVEIKRVIENELNSSNDNPLVIASEQDVFHNGHFHGQYIAMAMDQLAINLTTLSNLSDRRSDRFLDVHHSNGLPAFLSTDPGLKFGLMGGQFMATSLTAENRSLCVPVSIQTLTSTEDFQDIVSFGLVAARRSKTILENTKYVIAFELMCSCQAADFRGKEKLSSKTRALYELIRKIVPFYDKDYSMTDHLEALKKQIPFDLSSHLS
jgi:histidine ammonia-lyase